MHTRLNLYKGATLIEVMVALVIVAVGLLGLAGLQATSLQTNSNAEKRTQATIVANDMIERMRANPVGVAGGRYDAVDFAALDCTVPPVPYCQDTSGGGTATTCSPIQAAVFDAFIAKCESAVRMPSGTVDVQCTDNLGVAEACAGTAFRTLTVTWQSINESGASTKNISLIFRP